jgi:SNF2 family DNA or RNA helicase
MKKLSKGESMRKSAKSGYAYDISCLIICGINGTKYNWADEVKIHSREDAWVLGTRFTKRPPIKVVEGGTKEKLEDLNNIPAQFFWITNIETLRGGSYKEGKGKNAKLRFPVAERIQELIDNGTIGMVAFDEAHKAKNPDSQQGKALLSIHAPHPIPMSGTFLLNNPLDLYLPLAWAGFENHSFYQYKNHYCVYGGYGGKEVIGYKNLDELRSIMSKVMLRRTKGDVLDLPPKVHVNEYVEMTPEQKKLYKDVREQIRDNIDKIKLHPDPMSEMLRLRQVTGYPGVLSTSVTESAKMDRLEEMVEEIASVGEKCIVFSQWSTMTNVVRNKLKRFNPAYITGEVASEERMDEIKRFQNDPECKVIIGTIGAMGTGLTLTAASTVIFLDEPWNRGIKDQAEDRAHRIGTRGTVRIVTLITKDSVDEGVYNLVQKKGRMADLLIDGKVDGRNIDSALDYLLSFGG